MNVFISWSGDASHIFAKALKECLEAVIQSTRPFLSSEIDKGQRWNLVIGAKLNTSKFAILCLTRSNLEAPWILFEAGAVSNQPANSVSAVYLDIDDSSQVKYPLAQFQNTMPDKRDMLSLFNSINKALGEEGLDSKTLNVIFEKFWPDLETKIAEAKECSKQEAKGQGVAMQRSEQDMLGELLATARQSARQITEMHADLQRTITRDLIRVPLINGPDAAKMGRHLDSLSRRRKLRLDRKSRMLTGSKKTEEE